MNSQTLNNRSQKKRNDYPELQVGFPERNDASNPNDDMERYHVDLETFGVSKKSAADLTRDLRGVNTPRI